MLATSTLLAVGANVAQRPEERIQGDDRFFIVDLTRTDEMNICTTRCMGDHRLICNKGKLRVKEDGAQAQQYVFWSELTVIPSPETTQIIAVLKSSTMASLV